MILATSDEQKTYMSDIPFDVIIVPDFSGKESKVFELRTSLFLQSWIKNSGKAFKFPLHIACIGNPPESLKGLISKSNAFVSIHEPIGYGGPVSNKLRGLEITPFSKYFLLLDVDIIVISDPSDIAKELGYCISAAPAFRARISKKNWEYIYNSLHLPIPTNRIKSMICELGSSKGSLWGRQREEFPGEDEEALSMFPYYSSGVVYAPWDCGIEKLWGRNINLIAALFDDNCESELSLKYSNQAGLAVSIQQLILNGIPFKTLPYQYHAHWRHIARCNLKAGDIKLFHAVRIMAGGNNKKPIRLQLKVFSLKIIQWTIQDWLRLGFSRFKFRNIKFFAIGVKEAYVFAKKLAS